MDFAWLAPALCAAAFLINVLICRQTGNLKHTLSAAVSIGAILGAFVVFLIVFGEAVAGLGHGPAATGVEGTPRHLLFDREPWFSVGNYEFHITMIVDWVSIMMLGVVSFLGALIQIYAVGYMRGDNRFWWFFSVMSLFCAAMLTLVLSYNFLLMYIAWELVGLCSFLLIGFWHHERDNAEAAKKAFVTTRFGDVGFFIGLAILFLQTGTFQMNEIFTAIDAGRIDPTIVTIAGILVFAGAVGKSGQFPLHVWLPDAMAGPTPVSALVHSATMVAAGVYLVGRAYPLFVASEVTMAVIAIIGTITAIFAATIALTQRDIKRILAYSTVSQLGYMMMALGVGAFTAGLFHLFTHAFFKALLFLCAGSVIHSLEPVLHGTGRSPNDIFNMGGLRRRMPVTFWTFVIASLSLAGIPPLSGFWSKDAILLGTIEAGAWLSFTVALVTAFLTAFYMFRCIYLTFFGEERWRVAAAVPVAPAGATILMAPAAAADLRAAGAMDVLTRRPGEDVPAHREPVTHGAPGTGTHAEHVVGGQGSGVRGQGVDRPGAHDGPGAHAAPHESSWIMTVPLLLIAIPAAIAGWLDIPDLFTPFGDVIYFGEHHTAHFYPGIAIAGALAGLLGIGLATVMYWKPVLTPQAVSDAVPGVYRTLYNKYYFDEAYQWIIDRIVLGIAALSATFDRKVVNEGVVDTPAAATAAAGARLRYLNTGKVYTYALGFVAGIVLVGFMMVVWPALAGGVNFW